MESEERNALAKLEIELRYALRDISGKCNGETYEAVDKARRIIAELATTSDVIGYADVFAKEGFKDCIYIPATQQLCVKKILKCRVIAEE